MGLAKREWEEHWERGWSAPDKVVCPDCVADEFLADLVRKGATHRQCDYCKRRTRRLSAAPVEVIMPAVASALDYYYAEPTHAGVPYERGWVFEPTDTLDALLGVPFEPHPALLVDVAKAFANTAWVRAANGHWASSQLSDELSYAWRTFSEKVKYQSRYFFAAAVFGKEDWSAYGTVDILSMVAEMVEEMGLVVSKPQGSVLFRVRERFADSDWTICPEQVGAPPSYLANAGRMNPAGIAYLYLSTSERGALAEVLRGPPCRAVLARFVCARELELLDLTRLPPLPSVFEEGRRRVRETVLFLQEFIGDITQPVQKDGREHISYVPSQVVSEYFAQVFMTSSGGKLDGIAYPSAISGDVVNIALFPSRDAGGFEGIVNFDSGEEVSALNWNQFMQRVG